MILVDIGKREQAEGEKVYKGGRGNDHGCRGAELTHLKTALLSHVLNPEKNFLSSGDR